MPHVSHRTASKHPRPIDRPADLSVEWVIGRKVKIDRDTGCWDYTGRLDPSGYGVAQVGGRLTYIHRFVYQTLRDQPIDGLALHHLCHNKACCNPDHLEPLTRAEHITTHDNPVLARWAQA